MWLVISCSEQSAECDTPCEGADFMMGLEFRVEG